MKTERPPRRDNERRIRQALGGLTERLQSEIRRRRAAEWQAKVLTRRLQLAGEVLLFLLERDADAFRAL